VADGRLCAVAADIVAMNFAQVYLLDEKDKDEMEIEIKVIDLLQGL
jgi:hypothetical protein